MSLEKNTGMKLLVLAAVIIVLLMAYIAIMNAHLLGRVLHLAFPPKDLYASIITDANFRWDIESTKTYKLPCRYFDIYEVGGRTSKKVLSSGFLNKDQVFELHARLRIRILKDGVVLYESTSQEPKAMGYFKGDDNYIERVSFDDFPLPFHGRCNDLDLEVAVLTPDKEFQTLAMPELYVRVSTIP